MADENGNGVLNLVLHGLMAIRVEDDFSLLVWVPNVKPSVDPSLNQQYYIGYWKGLQREQFDSEKGPAQYILDGISDGPCEVPEKFNSSQNVFNLHSEDWTKADTDEVRRRNLRFSLSLPRPKDFKQCNFISRGTDTWFDDPNYTYLDKIAGLHVITYEITDSTNLKLKRLGPGGNPEKKAFWEATEGVKDPKYPASYFVNLHVFAEPLNYATPYSTGSTQGKETPFDALVYLLQNKIPSFDTSLLTKPYDRYHIDPGGHIPGLPEYEKGPLARALDAGVVADNPPHTCGSGGT
jgi:hypothetical protein